MRPTHQTDGAPLNIFSNCHAGIVVQLDRLHELPALLGPAALARKVAQQSLDFFKKAVFEHHAEEEQALFPAVLASATRGEEKLEIEKITKRLVAEHRALESLWERLAPALKKVAAGKDTALDPALLVELVKDYQAHALFEETHFLPKAHTILSRNHNHMEALDLTLHMRHSPYVVGHL